MYNIYMTTGVFGLKCILTFFSTLEEAVTFCEENNWEYIDENDFHWSLEIE